MGYAIGVTRHLCWGPDNRGAEGAEIYRRRDLDAEDVEEEGYGEGVSPSPADYGVWGSVVSSLSGVQGGAPDQMSFCVFRA